MIFSHVVAVSKNGIIGRDNDLPWDIPEDFGFFKDLTQGHIIIMGRKTYESLPGGKALPGRFHIVITRQEDFKLSDAVVVKSYEEAVLEAKKHVGRYPDEVFVVGGGQVYYQTLSQMNRVYLTLIHKKFEGTATYPLEKLDGFDLVARRDRTAPMSFSFLTYQKRI